MQESLSAIPNETTMMIIVAIAIAVLLVIVLVIVVSAMRIKAYKTRFENLLIETREKSKYIKKLEKETKTSNDALKKTKKELDLFNETKKMLEKEKSDNKTIQKRLAEIQNELEKAKGTLNALERKHTTLIDAHENLKKELQISLDENSKLRTTNTRLLTKLENEVAKTLQEQGKNQ